MNRDIGPGLRFLPRLLGIELLQGRELIRISLERLAELPIARLRDHARLLEAADPGAASAGIAVDQAGQLTGPQPLGQAQGLEVTRQLGAAGEGGRQWLLGWRSCSSTPEGSGIAHLGQQERTAGW